MSASVIGAPVLASANDIVLTSTQQSAARAAAYEAGEQEDKRQSEEDIPCVTFTCLQKWSRGYSLFEFGMASVGVFFLVCMGSMVITGAFGEDHGRMSCI